MASSASRMRSIAFQRPKSQGSAPGAVKVFNGVADMVDIVIGKGKIQRQQQDTLEQLFGARQARRKSQPWPLVHGLASPGQRCADPVRLQKSAQIVAPLC